MAADNVSNPLSLVLGLSKTTRSRAVAAARALLAQAGLEDVAVDAGERVAKLADEIVAASRANRDLFENMVATEVERATSRLGFARADEVEVLRQEVVDLRLSLAGEIARTAPAMKSPATKSPATKSPATKSPATKSPATKSPAKKAAPKRPAAHPSPVQPTPAPKTTSGSDS